MKEYQSLAHTKWDCKYHIVFIPKKRKKVIFGVIRKHLGSVLHELAGQKECKILEGHLMSDLKWSTKIGHSFRVLPEQPFRFIRCQTAVVLMGT